MITRLVAWLIIMILTAGCAATKQEDDQSPLEMARAYSTQKSGEVLLIFKNSELIVEDYQKKSGPQKRYLLAEASTFLSGLTVVAAEEDGLIELNEPVSKYISEWQGDTLRSQITIFQLLHLTSGLSTGGLQSIPTVKEIINCSLVHTPGEEFRHGATAFQLFGLAMKRKIGLDYLKKRILQPIGIEGEYWITVQGGSSHEMFPRLFDGAQLTAPEIGRLGQLLFQEGKWKGKTFISDISPLKQSTPASPGYGLGVWINRDISEDSLFLKNLPKYIILSRDQNSERLISDDAPPDLYMAAGRSNQRLYIIPSRNMVIVRLGRENLTWSDAEFLSRLLKGETYK